MYIWVNSINELLSKKENKFHKKILLGCTNDRWTLVEAKNVHFFHIIILLDSSLEILVYIYIHILTKESQSSMSSTKQVNWLKELVVGTYMHDNKKLVLLYKKDGILLKEDLYLGLKFSSVKQSVGEWL